MSISTKPELSLIQRHTPASLRDRAQWVAWKTVVRNGKPTKAPINPRTGELAKSNDKLTWGTFEQALNACRTRSNLSGIGFVFSPDDPYCGVDLDDCVDPDTGAIKSWASEFIDQLASYSEISPSGTGVKVFLKANKPGSRCRKKYADGEVEMYDNDRFFVVTGRRLESASADVELRQEQLEAVYRTVFGDDNDGFQGQLAIVEPDDPLPFVTGHAQLPDDEIIDLASKQRRSGSKFAALWGGDWNSFFNSASEADSSVVFSLAFYTKDAAQIDRLFRRSGLMRPKWDEQHGGTTYGAMTIAKALGQVSQQYQPKRKRVTNLARDNPDVFERAAAERSGRPTIIVDPAKMPVGDTFRRVTDRLLATGNCFSRAEQLVVVDGQEVKPILSHPELAGLLTQHVEFIFVDDKGGAYRPFPPSLSNPWLNNQVERKRLPIIKLFTHNPVFTDDWRLVAPGLDVDSGIYYAGPTVPARASTTHLDRLLQDFCFKQPGDRTNYLGVLLTALLVPRFIGSKPAALFNGNQPELGKSILAQIIAILRDGQVAETVTYNANDEEFEKRLGAIVRRGATTIIIDNAKSRGRNPKIESACLERSITDPILSFRLLGQSASIRAENSHIFCITANTPDVSRDLVTRSVIINLYYEGDPEKREFSIADPEGYAHEHRLELLGELIGMVERWKAQGMPLAKAHSRFNKRGWGNIVGGILQACGEPDFLSNAEEAALSLDETRREFTELVRLLADHIKSSWTPAELVDFCVANDLLSQDLGEGTTRSLVTKMGTLAGRFIDETFPVDEDREAIFRRVEVRKGREYRVFVNEKVPNL